jgi:hypothetical protein
MEEPRSETFLEKGDMFADHLGRRAERRCGGRERAGIRCLHEYSHAGESIHDYLLIVSNLSVDRTL